MDGYPPPRPQALQLQLPALAPHQLSYGLGSLQRLGCRLAGPVLDELLEAAAAMISSGSSSSGSSSSSSSSSIGAGASAAGGSGSGGAVTGPAAAAGAATAGGYSAPDLVLLLMTVARLQHVPSYAFTEAVTERLRPHIAAAAAAAAATAARYPSAGGAAASSSASRGDGTVGGNSSSSSGSDNGYGAGGATLGQGDVGAGLLGPAAAAPPPPPPPVRGAPVVVAMAGPGGELMVVEPLTCQELASVGYALAKLHSRPEVRCGWRDGGGEEWKVGSCGYTCVACRLLASVAG